jgi:hypothetical protein
MLLVNKKRVITIILIFILTLILAKHYSKSNLENQITITIRSIDSETKQPRTKDTVEIEMGKWGIPMRRYVKVGQYITDSLGLVKINIDCTERYVFNIYGSHVYSFVEFAEDKLKNGQQVIIEVAPPEKRMIPW